jgi:uncharacterized membrane protein
MFTAIAIALAVIALIVARSANRRVDELRQELDRLRHPLPVAPPLEPEPAAEAAAAPPAIPIYTPPVDPPPVAPPPSAPPPPPTTSRPPFDWENLIGIKLFSWIGGILFVLAAVFLFKEAIAHGWLRPPIRAAMGLSFGIALLVICELRVARNYAFTANAMDGAGIAILYATLFAMHARWQLVPSMVSLVGMLLVTAAAVYLSTRRDSVFIALLGLIGGFATPALLSSGANRPIALFSYLLLLNGGMSWIAYRKRWPLLTALSMALTVFYQWSWVNQFLTAAQLPLATVIFALFAVVGASALWARGTEDDVRPVFRRIASGAAVVPLVFAFFTAIVPEYGAQYWVLFGFLLLMTSGLAAIAILRGPEWLHNVGAVATLVTWFIWLTVSYTHASWPWSLVWLAVFLALYLVAALRLETIASYTAGLLFFVFIALADQEPRHSLTLIGAMLAMLAVVMVFAIMRAKPWIAAIAIGLSSIATMAMNPGLRIELVTHLVLLAALLAIAWIFERHVLAIVAVPFYAASILAASLPTGDSQLMFAGALYALFIAYPLLLGARVKQFFAPHLAAMLASGVFFIAAYDSLDRMRLDDWQGVMAASLGLVMVLLVWRLLRAEAHAGRLALVAGTALAFFTAAIGLQFENEWLTVALALEAAALVWLFHRVTHRGLLLWSFGIAVAVLVRLVFNPQVFDYHPKAAMPVFNWYLYTYLICATAMFVAAWLAPRDEVNLRRFFTAAGAIELFFLLNIEIADYYSVGDTLTFNFMGSSLAQDLTYTMAFNFMGSSLAQDLTYTMAWAIFAMAMLITGIALNSRSARVAALGLLLVTILKCFLHDLGRLGGLYRVASLFGLAVSLVAVGLMLQKFVMMKRESQPTA